jgi:N-methylhydantoinase B
MRYRVRGVDRITGTMFAMREGVPMGGVAGGDPGAPTVFRVHRTDGTTDVLTAHETRVELAAGEVFEFRAGSGGGWGDPLDRDPELVARDVTVTRRLAADDARAVYGVIIDGSGVDVAATSDRRGAIRRHRLSVACPPLVPVTDPPMDGGAPASALPLCHGVVQVGRKAVALDSGAVLAHAPNHWTDGCPVLEELRTSPTGAKWLARSYLDPVSGRALHVEAVPPGWPRGFATMPARWAAGN